jgi:RNA polymerase sigma-70 factor (ECF subfamily)
LQEPEPDIIRRAQRGDDEAFEQLVRLYLADVYRLARHIAGHQETAEDIAQDTFLNVYRALPRFRWRSKFSTWLFRIAHNCAVDAVRQASKHERSPPFLTQHNPPGDAAVHMALRAAVDELPDELRRPFTLVEVFGFTYTEAASILGRPVGTVKSRVHRARRLLIEAIANEEDAGEV